jgi:hypothetical protein
VGLHPEALRLQFSQGLFSEAMGHTKNILEIKSTSPQDPHLQTPFITATTAKMTKRTKKVGVTGKYGTRYVTNLP